MDSGTLVVGVSPIRRKDTDMTAPTLTVAPSFVMNPLRDAKLLDSFASLLEPTGDGSMPADYDLEAHMSHQPGVKYNGGGSWTYEKGGVTVTVAQPGGKGTNLQFTIREANGMEYWVEVENNNGQARIVDSHLRGNGVVDEALVNGINQSMDGDFWSNYYDNMARDAYKAKRKANGNPSGADTTGAGGGADGTAGANGMGGATGSGDGSLSTGSATGNVDFGNGSVDGTSDGDSGGTNWFIEMALALGEALNQMAKELKSKIDNVKLTNGQPPFKDAMEIQGLAQQLNFVSQAFMTALNVVGESLKTILTAGGAAR
jgi:hypothetical protein